MTKIAPLVVAALAMLTGVVGPLPAGAQDKVLVSTKTIGLHPGMDPGMYICGKGHLHIVGIVHNTSAAPVGKVKVAAKAYGADGRLLGEAASAIKPSSLAPGEKAEVNIEFLDITGPTIEAVKRHELRVVEAPAR